MEGDDHGGQSKRFATRFGDQTLGHLLLDHHHKPGHLGRSAQRLQQDGSADVVGKVGDKTPAVTGQGFSQIQLRSIFEPEVDIEAFGDLEEHRSQSFIHLIGDNPTARGSERSRQRAGTRSDLDDGCAPDDFGQFDDLPRDVPVRQEVLAEAPARAQPVLVQERGDLRPRLRRHRPNTLAALADVTFATSSGSIPQTSAKAWPL